MQISAHRLFVCACTGAAIMGITSPAAMAGENQYVSAADYVARSANHWNGMYMGADLSAIVGGAEIKRGAGNKKYNRGHGNISGGVHVGYNFAPLGGSPDGGWMFGTELGLTFTDFKHTYTDAILGRVKTRGNFVGTARLRAGYAWNKVYLYSSAGLALSDFRVRPAGNKSNALRAGLALGVGIEYAMTQNWSTRFEVNAYSFGREKYSFNGTKRKVDQGMVQAKLGVSYHF